MTESKLLTKLKCKIFDKDKITVKIEDNELFINITERDDRNYVTDMASVFLSVEQAKELKQAIEKYIEIAGEKENVN